MGVSVFAGAGFGGGKFRNSVIEQEVQTLFYQAIEEDKMYWNYGC